MCGNRRNLSAMGFRGYWGLGTRTPLRVQKPGDSSSPPKLLQRLQSGQRRGSGSGDHCRKVGDGPFPRLGSQQPLLCSLPKVSWLLWCFLREHHLAEATFNRSGQFATKSLRRGPRDSLVFYKFLIFFFKKTGINPMAIFCGTLASNL